MTTRAYALTGRELSIALTVYQSGAAKLSRRTHRGQEMQGVRLYYRAGQPAHEFIPMREVSGAIGAGYFFFDANGRLCLSSEALAVVEELRAEERARFERNKAEQAARAAQREAAEYVAMALTIDALFAVHGICLRCAWRMVVVLGFAVEPFNESHALMRQYLKFRWPEDTPRFS